MTATGNDTSTEAPQNAFTCELQVRWSDQDLNGHVNNARVITLIEEARIQAGQVWTGSFPNGASPRVVRSLQVHYDRPVHYTLPVTGKVWVSRIGNTSYTVCHELMQDGQRCCYAETAIVVLDRDSGRPAVVNHETRAGLGRYQHPDWAAD